MKRWGVVLLVLAVLIPNTQAVELDPLCHDYYGMIQQPGLTYEDVGKIADAMYHKQCWPAMQKPQVTESISAPAPTVTKQPVTRADKMRAFVPEFWQTMPVQVSPLCRRIMDEFLYAVSSTVWGVGSYVNVVARTKLELLRETTTTDPNVISHLDWIECRELLLWGIDNRQQTQMEMAAQAKIDAAKAERNAKHERRRLEKEEKTRRFHACRKRESAKEFGEAWKCLDELKGYY